MGLENDTLGKQMTPYIIIFSGIIVGLIALVASTSVSKIYPKIQSLGIWTGRNVNVTKFIQITLIWLGLTLWVVTGFVALYRFAIIETYHVSYRGASYVVIRNSLTGQERRCDPTGCYPIQAGYIDKERVVLTPVE